jgi:hypothetical protein
MLGGFQEMNRYLYELFHTVVLWNWNWNWKGIGRMNAIAEVVMVDRKCVFPKSNRTKKHPLDRSPERQLKHHPETPFKKEKIEEAYMDANTATREHHCTTQATTVFVVNLRIPSNLLDKLCSDQSP